MKVNIVNNKLHDLRAAESRSLHVQIEVLQMEMVNGMFYFIS